MYIYYNYINNKNGDDMYYINNFFLYSFVGFILETIIQFIIKSKVNSGILYGPWTIVYGFGVIIILLLEKLVFSKKNYNKWVKRIFLFLSVAICLTLIELLGGILIEKIFHKTFWNYSKFKFNIGKYISLDISIIWTVLSIIFVYILKPLTDKIIKKIPNLITYILIILMVIDFTFTLINKIRLQ